jgi:hypothetical protein
MLLCGRRWRRVRVRRLRRNLVMSRIPGTDSVRLIVVVDQIGDIYVYGVVVDVYTDAHYATRLQLLSSLTLII